MKLWDILKSVGSAAVKTMVPGGGVIIDVVNEFLPDDKKLPSNATGEQLQGAVDSLPPEQRAQLMEREFDVEIERYETLQKMIAADATAKHTTRPYIAKHSFHLLAIVTLVISGLFAWGVYEKDDTLVKAVTDGWPFVLSLVAPFVTLLHAYFGILRKERESKLAAMNGKDSQSGLVKLLGALRK